MLFLMFEIDQLTTVRYWLVLLMPLFGALVLFGFNYLYQNGRIRDKSLFWLGVSLLSWSSLGLLNIIWNYINSIISLANFEYFKSLIAPLVSSSSNIIFTFTAFQLFRVRELIERKNLLSKQKLTIVFVSVVSLSVFIFQAIPSLSEIGNTIDPVISLISLAILGTSITYSFYKYANNPFAFLTIVDFVYLIWYQFYFYYIGNKLSDDPRFIVANILSVSVLTLLFIALTLSWALSNTSKIKFINAERTHIVAMSLDLRGSTSWTIEMETNGDLDFVIYFKNIFSEWILESAANEPHNKPFLRFTGDGYILVWEKSKGEDLDDLANSIAGLACHIIGSYPLWLKNKTNSRQSAPKNIGIGIACGTAKRLTSENGSFDYEGIPISCAAKLQNLARPIGGIVIKENFQLSNELNKKFSKKGKLTLGNSIVPFRATKEVEYNEPQNMDR